MHDSSISGLVVYPSLGIEPAVPVGLPHRRNWTSWLRELLVGAPSRARSRVISSSATARIDSLDAARFIAVLGLLVVHAPQSPQLAPLGTLGTFGVPFYLFASLYMQARSLRRRPERPAHLYFLSRVRRLYLPFLGWSAIYLVVRNAKHLLFVHDGPVAAQPWQLWAGTALHLWFLPFLLVVSFSVELLHRVVGATPLGRWSVIIASMMIGIVLALVPRPEWLRHVGDEQGAFFFQCWKALPSVFLGIALAWMLAWRRNDDPMTTVISIVGGFMTVLTLSLQLAFGYSRLDRTLSGLGLLLLALGPWRGSIVLALARIGRLSYGIYLSHVLFIETVQFIARHGGLGASLRLDLFNMWFSLIAATLLAVWLQNRRWLAWLNG